MILLPHFVEFARQSWPPSLYNGLTNTKGDVQITKLTDFLTIIANLIQILMSISAVLAVIFIVWSGIQFAASSGDPGRVKEARNGLINAIIGLIISGGAYLLVDFFARQF